MFPHEYKRALADMAAEKAVEEAAGKAAMEEAQEVSVANEYREDIIFKRAINMSTRQKVNIRH